MQQSKKRTKKGSQPKKGTIRIIGGKLRGRKINFFEAQGLRPTIDRVRETLFNWLMADINGSSCLDLFSGSGGIGIEAISRGARQVTFVESNKKVASNLKENLSLLSISNAKVINQTAEKFLENNLEKFDLAFLDPPFDKGILENILPNVKNHISKDGLVYIEMETNDLVKFIGKEWEVYKSKKTASLCYSLIKPLFD